jgi:hypothetical protein
MDEKNGHIAHRRIVARRKILRNHGRNNNSPSTRIDGVVPRRYEIRLLNLGQCCRTVVVDVHIKVANGFDVFLRACAGFGLPCVHADVYIEGLFFILVAQPILEGWFSDLPAVVGAAHAQNS